MIEFLFILAILAIVPPKKTETPLVAVRIHLMSSSKIR